MERDCLEFYENLTSKDVLTSNFTFAAFFISTYEAIKTGICDKVKGLYCVETLQIKDGKFWAETTEKYKNEILDFVHTDKRKNTFKSSLLWLKEGGAIDDDEYIFPTIKSKVNMTAPSLPLKKHLQALTRHSRLKSTSRIMCLQMAMPKRV